MRIKNIAIRLKNEEAALENKTAVFVYGTLRRHMSNHRLLANAKLLSGQCWTYGKLFDTGLGYPAMGLDMEARVYGELYLISEHELQQLDDLEGYYGKEGPNHYERIKTQVYTDAEEIDAEAYIFEPDQVEGLEHIEHEDWKYHLLQHQQSFLYFGYGSMMDDKRLISDRVSHLFEQVIGRGILKGFSLKFTRKAFDGGRADIIEDEGVVEGKVYRIEKEALDYLEYREGLRGGIYRPIFVNLEISGSEVQDVLAFVVVDF